MAHDRQGRCDRLVHYLAELAGRRCLPLAGQCDRFDRQQVAADLGRAAALFDEVWYGGRPADASSYAVLVAVDERVSDRRPVTR